VTEFKCTSCGACCILAGKIGLMPSKKDGSCIYLNKKNQCDIYDNRPEICNVKRMYAKRVNQGLKMSYTDFCKINNKICNSMIDDLGLDKKYKIDIREYDE
jgi:Fe-S-cluster containining protein